MKLSELLDFETNWEKAVKELLDPLNWVVHTSEGTEELKAPYLSVFFEVGAPDGLGGRPQYHQTIYGLIPTAYRGSLQVQRVVNRGDYQDAGGMRGLVRARLLPYEETLQALLPCYHITEILPNGSPRESDEENEQDITALVYDVRFGIRSDSWPSIDT